MSDLPYSGLNVLEMGSRIAAGACGRMLADLGATVYVLQPHAGAGAAAHKWRDRVSALAGKQCNKGFFFASWQNDNQAEALGKYAVDKGYKKVYIMAPNYQSGRDQVIGFKRFALGEGIEKEESDFAAEVAAAVGG